MSSQQERLRSRLRDLPRRVDETWQGGLHELGASVACDEPGRAPFRPRLAAWIAVLDQKASPPEIGLPGRSDVDSGVAALIEFALNEEVGGYLPGQVEVRDEDLAARLRDLLGSLDVRVECREDLDLFDRLMSGLDEACLRDVSLPGLADDKGVTLGAIRSFAAAAVEFHRGAPWRELSNEDLISVESPTPPPGCEYASVLGAGGQQFGLGFFPAREEHWAQIAGVDPGAWLEGLEHGAWSVTFSTPDELPLADLELWARESLPLAAEDAYPFPAPFRADDDTRRPTGPELAFFEGLLQAIADTNEEEMDAGRWSKMVDTSVGRVEYVLSLPDLLDPPGHDELMRRGIQPDHRGAERATFLMQRFLAEQSFESMDDMNAALRERFTNRRFDELEFTPRTPLDEAQILCYEAFDTQGRRQLQLARKALAVCPDCADAYVILAEQTADGHEALPLLEQGVAAGARAMASVGLALEPGDQWGTVETRPYLRARYGLAACLEHIGESDAAVGHYREILRLDPSDALGVRYPFLFSLLQRREDEAAAELLQAYDDDESDALWVCARVLLTFRREGDSTAARRSLRSVIRHHPGVIDQLADTNPLAQDVGQDRYDPMAMAEAETLQPIVETTPGARDWLAQRWQAETKAASGRPQRGKRRRRKSR